MVEGIDLAEEFKAYQAIYDNVGPHPNLMNVYGIAQVPKNGEKKRTLLMDIVPGETGKVTFEALQKAWNSGKISSEEYWGAIQFIGRRLLDVTEHLGKAGVVHNDIKPENFLINAETGEPVLFDFGVWSKKGEKAGGGTGGYMSIEAANQLKDDDLVSKLEKAYLLKGDGEDVQYPEGVDERSDVFTVGATLLGGIEVTKGFMPNKGLFERKADKDRNGNVVREKASYAAKTAYTEFIDSTMKRKRDDRVNSQEAKESKFLTESMLDDDAAKKVIKKILASASEEEIKKQPQQAHPLSKEQSEEAKSLFDQFKNDVTLTNYAKLRSESKTNQGVRSYLFFVMNKQLLGKVKQDMAKRAEEYMAGEKYSWFDHVQRISGTVPQTSIKSGVDINGIRLKNAGQKADQDYERSVMEAKRELASYGRVEDLRQYADELETFLREARTLDRSVIR